ncbi:hypothetical protein NKG05_20540 [Oerskovia sp. M15]
MRVGRRAPSCPEGGGPGAVVVTALAFVATFAWFPVDSGVVFFVVTGALLVEVLAAGIVAEVAARGT